MIRFKQWYDLAAMTKEERRLYHVWLNMKSRCLCRTNKNWKDYGGRGIKVCDAWRNDFAQFIKDVGMPSDPSLELDRFPNNDGNYEPGNVRWATRTQNTTNVRSNRPVTIDGVTKLASEWADQYGIDRSTFCYRMQRGWTGNKLLSFPRQDLFITIGRQKKSAAEWAKQAGMTLVGFTHRVNRGIKGKALLAPSQKAPTGPHKK